MEMKSQNQIIDMKGMNMVFSTKKGCDNSLFSETQTKKKTPFMKRQTVLNGRRHTVNGRRRRARRISRTASSKAIKRRVKVLRRLVPNNTASSEVGVEGLFRETADYILDLQTRVRAMQTMVDVLTATASFHRDE